MIKGSLFNFLFRNKIKICLVLIVFLAAILRVYKIDQYPVSLYWDEVSSTYNAYSIASTGKDEFGNKLPLLFRAFEDYKTPANIYLTAIPVKLFGLNEFSARFTSVFFGTLTVLIAFFLFKEILSKDFLGFKKEYVALLGSFFLAISPWHTQFSRTGFEANVGLFFVVLGTLFFFRFIRRKESLNLYASGITFVASLYFYRSIWVFVPLFVLFLGIIFREELFNKVNLKKTLISIGIAFILLLPFIPIMISKQGLVRATQVNVVDNSFEQTSKFVAKQQNVKGLIGKVIYNRRVSYGLEITKGYLSHYSPEFLFFNGDGNGRHGVSGVGVMYLWGAVLILPGLIALFRLDRRTRNAIIAWILIAPIPAAVSVPAPHALRSLNFLPMPQLLCALGFFLIFVRLRKYQRVIFLVMSAVVVSFFSLRYLYAYYGPSAILTSSQWGDGYKQLVQYVEPIESKYDKVVVSGHYWQPYIYFLFYKKYDPRQFQESGSKKGFGKYIFGGTSWDMEGKELGDQNIRKIGGEGKILVALSPVEYSLQKDKVMVVKEIRNHNNELVFIVGELK